MFDRVLNTSLIVASTLKSFAVSETTKNKRGSNFKKKKLEIYNNSYYIFLLYLERGLKFKPDHICLFLIKAYLIKWSQNSQKQFILKEQKTCKQPTVVFY